MLDLDPAAMKDQLLSLVPEDGSSVGNATVYRKLRPRGWTKQDFTRVRAALIAERKITKGKGRGGSIRRLGGPQLELVPETPLANDAVLAELIEQVVELVRDHGGMTKQDLLAFGVSEAQYTAVQSGALAVALDLEKTPNKNGGLRVRHRAGDDAPEVVTPVHLEAWEEETIAKLCGWFKRDQLEQFLGDSLKHQIRSQRYYRTKVDRRSQSRELALALITAYGTDLLRHKKTLRDAIAKVAKIERLDKWIPGRSGARQFVADAGLPLELAGEPNAERPADSEIIERPIQLPPLADFQDEVKVKLEEIYLGRDRALASLPTGAGKTRTSVESIREYLTQLEKKRAGRSAKHTVLWLAHTEELCEQAFQAFRDCWLSAPESCSLFLCRFWGSYSSSLEKYRTNFTETKTMPSVLISTPQRIVNLLDNEADIAKTAVKELEHSLAIIVIDEAHRAGAPTYRRIIDTFAGPTSMVAVAGLTATPFSRVFDRKNPSQHTEQLAEIFEQLIVPTQKLGPLDGNITTHRQRLQERGYLAETESRTVQTQQRVTAAAFPSHLIAKIERGEGSEQLDRAIAQRVDRVPRRLRIADEILAIVRGEDPKASILYFGPSVEDAQLMAMLLREQKVRAAFVSGDTRMAVRRRLIDEFRRGDLQVLCNCEVLTTGFDAPRVTHIIMGRPTVSVVLYEQIVGRGLRGERFGGTKKCVIVDCVDDYSGVAPIRLAHEDFKRIWESRAFELVDAK